MKYNSLFDKLMEEGITFEYAPHQQRYQGTLNKVLNETKKELNLNEEKRDTTRLILNSPRIIKAFVEYKIQNPNAPKIESLLRDSIRLGLNIYRENTNSIQEIKELNKKIRETNNKSLLEKRLIQESDGTTWRASDPLKSIETLNNLNKITKGKSVSFIALAHGGVAAGMDTYLRYCSMANSDDSTFYVTKFSMHKSNDTVPQLTPTEKEYLQKQTRGKIPVLFDEDRYSGKTLNLAQEFFNNYVFPKKKVIAITNLDNRKNNLF